jgi:ubiquinol-cytochrome c reductase cytochrome b subunit
VAKVRMDGRQRRRSTSTTAALPLGHGVGRLIEGLRHRASPNHWSLLFGVVSFACLAVLIVTGLVLMFWYEPSTATVQYRGSYPLLWGVEMSKAFASTLHLSFDVPGGLLVRQAHHWAALVLPAALILQLLTTFFTGAFRKPRQWSWLILFGIFTLALAAGWSGYALPDDLLSGTGLRIVQGVTLGIPLVGTTLTWLLFGGAFPGRVIPHLYVIHLVASGVLVGLVAARLRLSWRQKPPQFPGPGRTEDNVVGVPVWPAGAAKAAGLFFVAVGVLTVMAGTMAISPVWLYGPSSPESAGAGSQPDWYTAFLDGALRLVPPGWEVSWLGRTWTLAVLVPLAAIGIFLALAATYPFLEGWISADHREHHLLDRPRNTPTRTGIGVAGMTFYGALWAAGSADLIATQFAVSFESVIWLLRGVAVLGPPIAYLLTRQVCLTLQASDRERLLHGAESGVIVRSPSGGYSEPHQPLSAARRLQLDHVEQFPPLQLETDQQGRIDTRQRIRARLYRRFYEDRRQAAPAGQLVATSQDETEHEDHLTSSSA